MPRYVDVDKFRKRIDHYPQEIRDTAKKELRYTPTADVVERRNGKWLHTDDMYEVPFCSKCRWEDNDYNEFKFCPNCGAQMDERREK